MPQNPTAAAIFAKGPSGALLPVACDADGYLSAADTSTTKLNITAATVVKAVPGKVISFTVVVAGAAGTINDCATTGAVAASNEIAATPATVGNYPINWPCLAGIVVTPGAGQTIAINYE